MGNVLRPQSILPFEHLINTFVHVLCFVLPQIQLSGKENTPSYSYFVHSFDICMRFVRRRMYVCVFITASNH